MKKFILLIPIILSASCCIGSGRGEDSLKIMSWNVQNLFDDEDNGDEYSEFSVKDGEWSSELYIKRLKLISGIISLNKPDIVALQEIEGESVLIDLLEYLPQFKYMTSTNTDSAIEQGFISKYPIERVGIINVGDVEDKLRPILEVELDINSRKLILFNNHWKSKSGGFTESKRIKSARTLRKRLDELILREYIVLGDLNENYDEYLRVNKGYNTALLIDGSDDTLNLTGKKSLKDDELFSPWIDSTFKGSYIYRGEYEAIDHFLINKNLMDREGFYFSSFYVDMRDSLFSGDRLNKWITDRASGYSDHLPILLELKAESEIITNIE